MPDLQIALPWEVQKDAMSTVLSIWRMTAHGGRCRRWRGGPSRHCPHGIFTPDMPSLPPPSRKTHRSCTSGKIGCSLLHDDMCFDDSQMPPVRVHCCGLGGVRLLLIRSVMRRPRYMGTLSQWWMIGHGGSHRWGAPKLFMSIRSISCKRVGCMWWFPAPSPRPATGPLDLCAHVDNSGQYGFPATTPLWKTSVTYDKLPRAALLHCPRRTQASWYYWLFCWIVHGPGLARGSLSSQRAQRHDKGGRLMDLLTGDSNRGMPWVGWNHKWRVSCRP